MKFEEKEWDRIIQPKNNFLLFNIKQAWDYRDLISLFVRRDIVTTYKQTILGPIWYLIQPICSSIMYLIIFGNLAQLGTDGIPQIMFYFVGTMLWSLFSSTLLTESNVFTSNQSIFGKVYFPRLTVPIAVIIGELVKFLIQFVLFLVMFIFYILKGYTNFLSLRLLLIPVIVLWITIMAMGIGLIISAITTKYHDLAKALSFFLSLFMYATPVVYPLSEVPEKYKFLFYFNPVSAPMECFRIVCFGSGSIPMYMIVFSVICTLIFAFGGIVLFNKNERTFVDVI